MNKMKQTQFNKVKNLALPTLISFFLAGCQLAPYEEEFACRKKDQLGKCINMQDSYEEAVTGESIHPTMLPKSEQDEDSDSQQTKLSNNDNSKNEHAYDHYVNSYYTEIASMVDNPITPMVKQAKTVRTLILPYPGTGNSKTLWMERYAYSIVEEPNFVMGQYLTKQPEMLESLLKNKK